MRQKPDPPPFLGSTLLQWAFWALLYSLVLGGSPHEFPGQAADLPLNSE